MQLFGFEHYTQACSNVEETKNSSNKTKQQKKYVHQEFSLTMFLKCFLISTRFQLHVSYINVSYIKKRVHQKCFHLHLPIPTLHFRQRKERYCIHISFCLELVTIESSKFGNPTNPFSAASKIPATFQPFKQTSLPSEEVMWL